MIRFIDPRSLPVGESVVGVGGELSVENLRFAYRHGIFPWPIPGYPVPWHCPDQRGILDFSRMHVPRSLRQRRRREGYQFTFNRSFRDVLLACAEAVRPGEEGTWITEEVIRAYCDFHEAGYAHSVECRRGDVLVGGLYGVYVDGVFSGESMYYREPDTSKLCLWVLVEQLREAGMSWMDVQMVTPVVEVFGGEYVGRNEFLKRLDAAHALELPERLEWQG